MKKIFAGAALACTVLAAGLLAQTIQINGNIFTIIGVTVAKGGSGFSNQDDMTLYVSKDKNQIPVRVESAILVGSVKADLISYEGLKYPFTAKVR